MRTAAKVDANQTEIVRGLRAAGCTVRITSVLGDGFPDAVVGRAGVNYLLEIKDGRKAPSKRKLTPDEQEFFDTWNGQVVKVETLEDAYRAVGL